MMPSGPLANHRRTTMNYLSNKPGLLTVLLTSALTGIAQGDEKSALAALTKVGAIIEGWDKTATGEHPARVAFHGQKNMAVALKNLKELSHMSWLDLGGSGITDAGLKELKDLPQLRSLLLSVTKVTDEGLKNLRELKQLTYLDLSGTMVTDVGLKELKV